MAPRTLGMRWLEGGPSQEVAPEVQTRPYVNTRTSLWPVRWPAIALQSCIDIVEAATPEDQPRAKNDLPCSDCPMAAQCLNAKRKELGGLLYDREILTTPRSSESSLFPRELMAPMLNPGLRFEKTWFTPADVREDYAVIQAWDLAWSERTGGDYLVCATAVVDKQRGQARLIQMERWQRLTFDEQCRLIEAKWRQYRPHIVVVESDGAQQVWTQHLSSTTAVPVVPHAAANKKDFTSGVPGILISFQNRKWEFPYDRNGWNHSEMENFLSELEAFGFVEGKLEGVGEHDDTVMCFWHLWWGVQTFVLNDSGGSARIGTQSGRSL